MIKKRNLDNSLIQWIMTTTGLGPGIGKIKHVAPAETQYRTQAQEMGVPDSDLFTAVEDAYAAMVANRNDVCLMYPGNYWPDQVDAAPMTWAKARAHLLGLHNHSMTVNFESNGVDNVFVFKSTANANIFQNFACKQWGENVACISCVEEAGGYNHWKNVYMMGAIRSEIAALTTASSLHCSGGGGKHNKFIGCKIGHTGGSKMTGVSGVIRVTETGSLATSKFTGCEILSISQNANPCGMLFVEAAASDRLVLLKDCVFYNFNENHGATQPSYAIRHVAGSPTTHDVLLKDCARLGYGAWCNNNTFVFATGPKGATDGGEAVAADTS